jgi:saposin
MIPNDVFFVKVLDPNPLECTVCQYVIQFLDLELKGNKTEAAVVNALKNVCKFTPASLRDQCDSLVSTYGVYLVQLLLEFSDPLKVCQALKVC